MESSWDGEAYDDGKLYDESRSAEPVSELGRLVVDPDLEPEPEPRPEHIPGSVIEDSLLSVMAHKRAAAAKDAVRTTHEAAREDRHRAFEEQEELEEALAERHVFSNAKYAEKVAAKRRAKNLSEGQFADDARRESIKVQDKQVTKKLMVSAARNAVGVHQTGAERLVHTVVEEVVGEKRRVALLRSKSDLRYSLKIAAKREAHGLDAGEFVNKAKLEVLVARCQSPVQMGMEDLQEELDLRGIDRQHMEREELVHLAVEARTKEEEEEEEEEEEREQKWRDLRNDKRTRAADEAATAAAEAALLKRRCGRCRKLAGTCCRSVHFFGAPNHEIEFRHRVPMKKAYTSGMPSGKHRLTTYDASLENDRVVMMGKRKQRCHKLMADITDKGLHVFILLGVLLIYALTAVAISMQGTTRVITFIVTCVFPGGVFLLFLFRQGCMSCMTSKDDLRNIQTNLRIEDLSCSSPRKLWSGLTAGLTTFWPAVYVIWGYTAVFLTLAPMIMMAPADIILSNATDPEVFAQYIGAPRLMSEGKAIDLREQPIYGTVGFMVYGIGLWSLGWLFLWWYWEITEKLNVRQSQRSRGLPVGFQPRLKFFATIYEAYTYSAFSFFQAIPWDSVSVPEEPLAMPRPRHAMIMGMMEFEGLEVRKYVFYLACLTVLASPVFLLLTSRRPGRHTAVVQLFFELLAFPMIKQMTSVFACTAATTELDGKIFCQLDVLDGVGANFTGAQCMDNDPTQACWTDGGPRRYWGHLHYVWGVMLVLTPYYVAALHVLLEATAKMSVVAKDARWSIVSFQSKVMLALLASSFGDCHPQIILSAVGVVVCSLLYFALSSGHDKVAHAMRAKTSEEQRQNLLDLLKPLVEKIDAAHKQRQNPDRKDNANLWMDTYEKENVDRLQELARSLISPRLYSSVLAINCTHVVGLWMAGLNGLLATLVLLYNDAPPRCSSVAAPALISESSVFGALNGSHSFYWAWVALNTGVMFVGYLWYRRKKTSWDDGMMAGMAFKNQVNKSPYREQVNYAVLQARVDTAQLLSMHEGLDKMVGEVGEPEYMDGEWSVTVSDESRRLQNRIYLSKAVIEVEGVVRDKRFRLQQFRRKGEKKKVIADEEEALRLAEAETSLRKATLKRLSDDREKSPSKRPTLKSEEKERVIEQYRKDCTLRRLTRKDLRAEEESKIRARLTAIAVDLEDLKQLVQEDLDRKKKAEELHDEENTLLRSLAAGDLSPEEEAEIRAESFGTFAVEVHLIETQELQGLDTHELDCHQQLEKPALQYVLAKDVPVKIKGLDIQDLKIDNDITEMNIDKDITNTASGDMLVGYLLNNHFDGEKKVSMVCCRKRVTCRRCWCAPFRCLPTCLRPACGSKTKRIAAQLNEIELNGNGIHGHAITAILSRHLACKTINLSRCSIGVESAEDINLLEQVLSERAQAYATKHSQTHVTESARPKKAMSAYLCYVHDVRNATAKDHPKKSMTELSRVMNKQWHSLSDKRKYHEMAHKDKLRYEKQNEQYSQGATNKRNEAARGSWLKVTVETVTEFVCDPGTDLGLELFYDEAAPYAPPVVSAVAETSVVGAHCSTLKTGQMLLAVHKQSVFGKSKDDVEGLLNRGGHPLRLSFGRVEDYREPQDAVLRRMVSDPPTNGQRFGLVSDHKKLEPMKLQHRSDSAESEEILKLDLSNNPLRDIGGQKLFKAIRMLKIVDLDVSACLLGHDSIAALADTLGDKQSHFGTHLSRLKLDVASKMYFVNVVTGKSMRAALSASCEVTMQLFGTVRTSDRIALNRSTQGDEQKQGTLFQRGAEDEFTVYSSSIGQLKKIRIGFSTSKASVAVDTVWHLERVEVWQPGQNSDRHVFHCQNDLSIPAETEDQNGELRVDAVMRPTPPIGNEGDDLIKPYWEFSGGAKWADRSKFSSGQWQPIAKFPWWEDLKLLARCQDSDERNNLLDPRYDASNIGVQQAESLLLRHELITDDEPTGKWSHTFHGRALYQELQKIHSKKYSRNETKWSTRVCEVGMIEKTLVTTQSEGKKLTVDKLAHIYELLSEDPWKKGAPIKNLNFEHVALGPADLKMISVWLRLDHVMVDGLTARVYSAQHGNLKQHEEEEHKTWSLTNKEARKVGFNLSQKQIGPADLLLVSSFLSKHLPDEQQVLETRPNGQPRGFELNLSSCPIVGFRVDLDLSGLNSLCDVLRSVKPTVLELSGCKLGPASVAALAHFVKHSRRYDRLVGLWRFDISHNYVLEGEPLNKGDPWRPIIYGGMHPWQSLCAAVRETSVEEFLVGYVGLDPQGCKTFASSVNENTTKIDLSGNLITGSVLGQATGTRTRFDYDCGGLKVLRDTLEATTNLRSICFANCQLGTDATKIVASMLQAKVLSLTELDLSGCTISKEGKLPGGRSAAQDLASAVKDCGLLRKLAMGSTGVLGESRIYTLCESDAHMDLSNLNMGEADLNIVAAWLSHAGANCQAAWAAFGGNALREDDDRAKRLKAECPKLKDLIKAEAAECDATHRPGLEMSVWRAVEWSLKRALGRLDVRRFQRLDLSGCWFPPEAVSRLVYLLADASSLNELSLRGSTLVREAQRGSRQPDLSGFEALCEVVGMRLSRWDLSGCGLTSACISVLATTIDWNKTNLRKLNLCHNPVAPDQWHKAGLAKLLTTLGSSSMKTLELMVDEDPLALVDQEARATALAVPHFFIEAPWEDFVEAAFFAPESKQARPQDQDGEVEF